MPKERGGGGGDGGGEGGSGADGPLDPIVLGHNPFFGVDHLSRRRGAEREARFERTDAIVDLYRAALDEGVRGAMVSTHPRATALAASLRTDRALRDVRLYVLLPYLNKYVREANEKGLVRVVLDQVRGVGFGEKLRLLRRGGLALLRRDVHEVLRALIHVELLPFRGLDVRAVLLPDALTDLALALDMRAIFELYLDAIAGHRPGALAGFATKNLPLLTARFRQYGLERPLVLAHLNKDGFGMNPSREAVERCLAAEDLRVMAMGTLASGYLAPDEAYDYVFSLPAKVESVVVGVSTPAHARETFAAIRSRAHARIDGPVRAASAEPVS